MQQTQRPSTVAKVVLLGATDVGKTCIVSRLVTGAFDPSQKPTIGGSFSQKDFDLESGPITLRIWDTAGQERYRSLASLYYQSAHCALLVFSLTSMSSFREVEYWVEELRANYDKLPPLFLVGNMVDLAETRAVKMEDAKELAVKLAATYVETSALTGEGIDELFESVAAAAMKSATQANVDRKMLPDPSGKQATTCC